MKKIFMNGIVIVFVGLSGSTNAQWFPQNYPDSNSTIRDIFALDQNTAVAVGFDPASKLGIIYKTTDGGENWLCTSNDTSIEFNSVFFINPDIGWAAGGVLSYAGIPTILKTTDEGNNWFNILHSGLGILNSVYFVDENHGWIVGNSVDDLPPRGIMYKSTDGGINWILQENYGGQVCLNSVYFTDEYIGYAVGSDWLWFSWVGSKIIKTTDGGNIWVNQSFENILLNTIHFINPNYGWIVGSEWIGSTQKAIILNTVDGGENWSNQLVQDVNSLVDIYFINQYTGWSVGSSGTILYTDDGGNTWITQQSSTTNNLNAIYFVNEYIGWAVGENGTILKTTNGGVTFLEEGNKFTQPDRFLLEQNYPNPFNPITNISYTLPTESQVKLSIYNTLGELVETIVNEKQSAGKYDVVWNAGNQPSGAYIYTLDAVSVNGDEQKKLSKKMILLK